MTLSSWQFNQHVALDDKHYASAPGAGGAGVRDDEGANFVRVLAHSTRIRRHTELIAWLRTDVQKYLPHQALIGAWGDFSRWNVKCEVLASLPDVPLASPGCRALDALLREAHAQWVRGGRKPLLLEAVAAPCASCGCALHRALGGMHGRLVHGVRDKRSGCDSLYVALDTRRLIQRRPPGDFVALAHLLFCQIDIAWRRVAASRLEDLRAADDFGALHGLELSAREREILMRLARGSTNHDIAEALQISLFTVKNHLKRIFRKTGASNRTQAVALYNDALAQSTKGAAG